MHPALPLCLTPSSYAWCLHSLFENQARTTPDAVAVVAGRESLTYSGLNARANQLAHYLRAMGVGPEALVGLFCERSLELTVALLAVSKTGGAFVPLTPDSPPARRDFILRDARIGLVLTQERCRAGLPPEIQSLCLDSEWHKVASQPVADPAVEAAPDSLAYVLYTSGSTGRPKGVAIPHRGFGNYLVWARQAYGAGLGEGAPVHSSIGFDATLTSFTPLLAGKAVFMLPEGGGIATLVAFLQSGRDISVLKITPAHLDALAQVLPEGESLRGVRAIVVGGEALLARHVAFCRSRAPLARIFNEYGPTETVVGCSCYEVPDGSPLAGSVPIGRAIANTQLFVLDQQLQPVPTGVAGELFIGGEGVARGYHNRADLTAEKFIVNPFGGGRLFRSGDLVRELPDGNLVYLGRLDNQVKIRGFRVELGEIEASLAAHPAVRSCAVLLRVQPGAPARLTAYAACSPDTAESGCAQMLKRFLGATLPDYMVPADFVFLESMPLTPHGKVDRAALQSIAPKPDAQAGRSPRNSLELRLLRIWESTLSVRNIGIRDNFFELGGESLAALRLVRSVEKATGQRLPLSAFFQGPTIEGMARCLAEHEAHLVSGPLVAIQAEGSRPPLFCIHGLGGNILGYGHLARYLPDDQPLYGLQARGLDGREPPLTRVEDMAALYISHLRTVQPAGPYRLVGYSFGGLVAFEMARQLEAAGDPPGVLVLLDTTPSPSLASPSNTSRGRAFARRQAGRILLHGGNLRRLNFAGQLGYIGRGLRTLARKFGNRVWQARHTLYERFSIDEPRAFFDVKQAAYMAARQYVPARYRGRAVLLRARQHSAILDGDPALGWNRWVEGGVDVRFVPGEHTTITVGENAAVLAREITSVLGAGAADSVSA